MDTRRGLVALLLVAACGGDSSVEKERRPHLDALAKRFGGAILRGDFLAAYAMTSTRHYQDSMDLSSFKDLLEQAREEYGEAAHLGLDSNTYEADGPLGEDLDFPESVPVKDRRARLVIRMLTTPNENDAIYEIWINVIDEGGENRIVTVEIPGINM